MSSYRHNIRFSFRFALYGDAEVSQPERAGHREMSMLRHCLARLGARLELVAVFEVGDEEHAVSIHIGETDTTPGDSAGTASAKY